MQQLYYKSTRGRQEGIVASEAILKGIADDGGLFVPQGMPKLEVPLEKLQGLSYQELAYEIMKLFFSDFTEKELKNCIEQAYDSKFDTPQIAPVIKKGQAYFLELFHGPTLAFKDMALSILPYLLKASVKKQNVNKDIVILTATSGDTGKAAMEGFADVEGTKIIVFFPQDGVSPIQKQQMVTQSGNNTYVIGIKGNFDDAQSGVKEIFTDQEFSQILNENNYMFSSANSINIGRLIPQVVYYFYGYFQMLNNHEIQMGEKINVTVPTGNFGNILAGYYAKQLGLPINKLICASNDNKVLFDFFATGEYDKNREFIVTTSPSMDILISSNLERLIYKISGDDPSETKERMNELKTKGKYSITEKMKEQLQDFYGGYANQSKTDEMIKEVYEDFGYVMDPHTAVAYAVFQQYMKQAQDNCKNLIVSTASPYKFTKSVMQGIDKSYESINDFELMKKLNEISKVEIPNKIKNIEELPVLHNVICTKEEMKEKVAEFLGIKNK